MPMKIEPKSGLAYGWDEGESGWKDGMDANLLRVGLVGTHLEVLDKDLTDPPESPTNGDSYIVPADATGDWLAHEGDVAIWLDASSSWVFYTPALGWLCYVSDEPDALYIYKALGWSIFESGGDAIDVDYDNTESGLLAVNVQEAIDELKTEVDAAVQFIDGGNASTEYF